MKKIGAVILAGGQSRRMGTDKAHLQLQGQSFLERIRQELSGFEELLLSVSDRQAFATCGLPIVEDRYPDSGPISGIYSALSCCQADYLLTVSCDIPLFSAGLAEFMLSYVEEGYEAFPAVTRDGRIHPMCCIYAKSALPFLAEKLRRGDLRLLDVLAGLRTKPVQLKHSAYADELLFNVNNHAQYLRLHRQLQGPPVVAVSGIKNSGKTLLLCNLLPHLKQAGLKVAAVKHDGHSFEPDVPGTDSYTLRQAGADGVAIYSGEQYMVTDRQPLQDVRQLLPFFPEVDLLLLEGGKHSAYPKIEIVRQAISQQSVCDPATLLALCTDTALRLPGVPGYALEDYAGLARRILRYLEGEVYPDTSAWAKRPAIYGFPVPDSLTQPEQAPATAQPQPEQEVK